MKLRFSHASFLLCALLLCLASPKGHAVPLRGATVADPVVVNRVVAVVGKRPILLSDVQSEDPRLTSESDPEFKNVLNRVVDEILIEEENRRANLLVSQDEIDRERKRVMEFNHIDERGFDKALQAQGLSSLGYEKQLRRMLNKMKFVQSKVSGKIQITDEDKQAAYRQLYGEGNLQFKIRARHIFVGFGAQKMIDYAYNELSKSKDFYSTATALSQKNKQIRFQDLGVIQRGELFPEFDTVAFSLPVGNFSKPFKTSAGWHIVWVQQRIPVEKVPFETVEKDIEKKLYEEEVERGFRDALNGSKSSTVIEYRQ